jgi:hypothetical protein
VLNVSDIPYRNCARSKNHVQKRSTRVGGGARGCPHASLRPPPKLHVRFSRMQLLQRFINTSMPEKELA